MKITKTWLAKVAAILTQSTSLLHRISPPASFYSKTKIVYIFSFHSFFGVLIFTFDMRVWMTYLFCVIKNNGNNVRCTTEGKSQTNIVRRIILFTIIIWIIWFIFNHIICSFKMNSSRISLSQLSVSSFLEKIYSAKEKY